MEDVAHICVVQSAVLRHALEPEEGVHRGHRRGHHVVIRVESGEMYRYVGGQAVPDPFHEFRHLPGTVVLPRYDQIGEFQMDALFEDDLAGPLDILQLSSAKPVVESVVECLDVYVHGIRYGAELLQRFFADVSVGHQGDLQVGVALVDVHDVLEPDAGFVVGECDLVEILLSAERRYVLGRFERGTFLADRGHGDGVVLTVFAVEVASDGPHGEYPGARPVVVERLLLYRVHGHGRYPAVVVCHQFPVNRLAGGTAAETFRLYAAAVGAKVACHDVAVFYVPVSGLDVGVNKCHPASPTFVPRRRGTGRSRWSRHLLWRTRPLRRTNPVSWICRT